MWRYLFLGVSALMLAIGLGRFAYTPILPMMLDATNLSVKYSGYLASINYVGYTIGALTPLFWNGPGIRIKTLRMGIGLSVIGLLMMSIPLADSIQFSVWSAARLLSGIGSSWILINVSSLILEELRLRHRLDLMGVLYSGVGIGALLATFSVDALGEWFDWRQQWQVMTMMACVIAILLFLFFDEKNKQDTADGKVNFSVKDIHQKDVWLLAAIYFCQGFSYIMVVTFLPVITQELDEVAQKSWLLLLIAAVPSCVFWGKLSKRFGNIACLIAAYLIQAIAIFVLAVSEDSLLVVVASIMVGLTFMGIVTMILAQAQYLHAQAATLVMGLVTGCYSVGQVIGPSVAGYIAQVSGSFSVALLIAAAFMLAATVLLFYLAAVVKKMRTV